MLLSVLTAAVPRTHSVMLVPCASQELPAPQLMQANLQVLQPPLPELDAQHSTCSEAAAPGQPQGGSDATPSLIQSGWCADSPTPLAMRPEVEGVTAQAQAQAHALTVSPRVVLPTEPFSAGYSNTLSELMLSNSSDDIQAGIDSPRSSAAHRHSVTLLPSRSHAGTPGPGKAVG